jgi:hypothetical protein
MARSKPTTAVFINCPFDSQYTPLFEALVFAVSDCGFRARCALEVDDASQVRIEKIYKIIAACKYGIHDISRTAPSPLTGLPRFNMPLELGMFLAAKRFGSRIQREKVCLILDSVPHRYQQFISDIAGQDIQAHHDDPKQIITAVRNWLRTASQRKALPGGAEIYRRFLLFQQDLPVSCGELKLERNELTYYDYTLLIADWLAETT